MVNLGVVMVFWVVVVGEVGGEFEGLSSRSGSFGGGLRRCGWTV